MAANPAMAGSLISSGQRNFVAARGGGWRWPGRSAPTRRRTPRRWVRRRARRWACCASIGALSIAASLLLAWQLSANVTNRLRRAITVSEAISRGELDVTIPNAGSDEVGNLVED